VPSDDQDPQKPSQPKSEQADKVALSLATAFIVLHHKKYRRNLLFGLTALAMFLVFGGVVFLGDKLMKNPIAFVAFWGICFVTVILVCFLAIYDMLIIRKEHQAHVESFEDELAAAEAEARILATQEKAKMAAEEANGDS